MVSKEFTFVQREIKKNVIQFIAIGRLVKDKRYLELIKSFYNAFQNTEDVELLIIGNGPEEKPLQKLINQFDLKNKVKLMGFMYRDNVAKKLQESDIYVSASKTETFGVPYIEALACGTPIIGKKNGVIENLLANIDYGKYYENIKELESIMLDMYNNIESYKREILSIKTIESYGEKSMYNQLAEIYTEVRK